MSLYSFLLTLLFLDFLWSVSAFIFGKPHPLHLFWTRFWLFPAWCVYLLLLSFLVYDKVTSYFLFKYLRTVWVRQPRPYDTPVLAQEFAALRRPVVTVPQDSTTRDISSATPTTPRRPFGNV